MEKRSGKPLRMRSQLGQRKKGNDSRDSPSLFSSIPRRFPVVSGFRVRWDSRKAPGERLIDISIDRGGAWKPIVRDEKGVKYCVVTREYMADGHDGYEELLGRPRPINEEAGQLFSTIIRRYLLGGLSFFLAHKYLSVF
jgi:hypothetical protein